MTPSFDDPQDRSGFGCSSRHSSRTAGSRTVPSREILLGGGGIHCITLQEPSGPCPVPSRLTPARATWPAKPGILRRGLVSVASLSPGSRRHPWRDRPSSGLGQTRWRSRYEEHGPPDSPVVMLLHGFPDDARAWDAVAPGLVDAGYRVIVPYLRGFGPTTLPRPGAAPHGPAGCARPGSDRPDGRPRSRPSVPGRPGLGGAGPSASWRRFGRSGCGPWSVSEVMPSRTSAVPRIPRIRSRRRGSGTSGTSTPSADGAALRGTGGRSVASSGARGRPAGGSTTPRSSAPPHPSTTLTSWMLSSTRIGTGTGTPPESRVSRRPRGAWRRALRSRFRRSCSTDGRHRRSGPHLGRRSAPLLRGLFSPGDHERRSLRPPRAARGGLGRHHRLSRASEKIAGVLRA